MAPFDRTYTTFYWSAVVNIALPGTVFELSKTSWVGCKFLLMQLNITKDRNAQKCTATLCKMRTRQSKLINQQKHAV